MQTKVLSPEQIEQFTQRGWTKISAAIPPGQTAKVRDFLWNKLEHPETTLKRKELPPILRNDPTTWRQPMAFLSESYNGSPFDECATARLDNGCTDVVGDGRWIAQGEIGWWGWWPVNFAVGADQTWDVPGDEWHFDGPDQGWQVNSPDQGLLVIGLFSALGPRGGGTLILEGSHILGARALHQNPDLNKKDLREWFNNSNSYLRALTGRDGQNAIPGVDTANKRGANAAQLDKARDTEQTERTRFFMDETHVEDGVPLRVVEVTGEPGDVILAHPFLYHSPSFNHSGIPRFMCNRKATLKEPMNLEREDGNYSPLEESIRRAIAVVA